MNGKHSLHDIEEAEKKPLWQRLGWLALIWVGSVGALFIVASLMRLFMNAAGLTTHRHLSRGLRARIYDPPSGGFFLPVTCVP